MFFLTLIVACFGAKFMGHMGRFQPFVFLINVANIVTQGVMLSLGTTGNKNLHKTISGQAAQAFQTT